jgi:hypothetical protein
LYIRTRDQIKFSNYIFIFSSVYIIYLFRPVLYSNFPFFKSFQNKMVSLFRIAIFQKWLFIEFENFISSLCTNALLLYLKHISSTGYLSIFRLLISGSMLSFIYINAAKSKARIDFLLFVYKRRKGMLFPSLVNKINWTNL